MKKEEGSAPFPHTNGNLYMHTHVYRSRSEAPCSEKFITRHLLRKKGGRRRDRMCASEPLEDIEGKEEEVENRSLTDR